MFEYLNFYEESRQDIAKNTESTEITTCGKGPFFLLVTADEWDHDAQEVTLVEFVMEEDRFRTVDRCELDSD